MGEPLSPERVAEIRQQWGSAPRGTTGDDVRALCDTVDALRAERDGIARRIRDGWEPDVLLPEPPDWSGRWVRVDRLDARTEEMTESEVKAIYGRQESE